LFVFIIIIDKQIYKYYTQSYNFYVNENEFRMVNYSKFWPKLTIHFLIIFSKALVKTIYSYFEPFNTFIFNFDLLIERIQLI